MSVTTADFVTRFKDPTLRAALEEMWLPEFSFFFMLATFAYLLKKNAGYPIGGSLPISMAMANRYVDLGGVIHYSSPVSKILVENDTAVGIRLADGTEHRADRVISAADGYATLFKMLDEKYLDEKTREPYEKWPGFPPASLFVDCANRIKSNSPRPCPRDPHQAESCILPAWTGTHRPIL